MVTKIQINQDLISNSMFLFMKLLFVLSFFPQSCPDVFYPISFDCERTHSELWWDRSNTATDVCEVFGDNEECGVCGREHYKSGDNRNRCYHFALWWKYDLIRGSDDEDRQVCLVMDHCVYSYPIKFLKLDYNVLNYICGTETQDGKREQRGDCKSGYGTYMCECKKPFQGRDCNDLGPEGAFATGVQVVMETRARVSSMMTIMIAVKGKGIGLKVLVNIYNTNITITEPIIDDPSSKKLIKYCEQNTALNKQCSTYLNGSTSVYSVNLRFPLVRDNSSMWYYEDGGDQYPVGYFTNLTITATNTIDGVDKESFFRTHYDRIYRVFVQYPLYIGCYENPFIINCNEVQEMVNVYDASNSIFLYGDLRTLYVHGERKVPCSANGEETMKWKLVQVMPDASFRAIDKQSAETAFEFAIKPYSLKNGRFRVEFSFAMTTKSDITENFDQCFFTVVEGPLIAWIEGGKSRYVNVDTVIILDGSRSSDPNLQGEDSRMGLSFEWSCITNKTSNACLEDYLSPRLGSKNYIKLPSSVLEDKQEYIIKLKVTKLGKNPAHALQTLFTGSKGNIQSMEVICLNCLEENIANPTDYIYLLVQVVYKPNTNHDRALNHTWTFSTHPVYPPETSTDSIRVDQTSQDLLKIKKYQLQYSTTYWFRAAIREDKPIFAEIDIRIPLLNNFTCSLTPVTGTVAVTDFIVNCSASSGLVFEVYDKSLTDPHYYSGRMLFTGNYSNDGVKLANEKLVVYGYNKYKMIQEWSQEVKLTSFDGTLTDIKRMMLKLEYIQKYQTRLHSASVIPGALKPEIDSTSINLFKHLITLVSKVKLEALQHIKLVLSSLEFIVYTMTKNGTVKNGLDLKTGEAKVCADILSALGTSLTEIVKGRFAGEVTLTETILHQMVQSHLNVIEIVLKVKYTEVQLEPSYLVNPYVLYLVKDTSYKLVDALYKMSTCLLWRQIQGDSATEIVSAESAITEWALVHQPEVLYRLRRQNQSIPFNFSFGFYKIMKNLDVLGIQVTKLNINPFWWAGGDINTNILLVDICFKVNFTTCKNQKTFYKVPIFLYFNISQSYNSIKPLEFHTVYLNLSKHHHDLDLDMTVYRFDPPLRAKLFIQFEFENPTDTYMVLFSINKRPDFEMLRNSGITINNENQSTIRYVKYIKDDSDKLYYMGIVPVHEGATGKKAKFKLTIVYVLCKTWLRWKWGSERCWVGEQETNEETLRCDCNHLSMFAGTVQVPSYTLNLAMEFMLYLTAEFNWLPLLVLAVVFLFFIILYVWGWRKDGKDATKATIIILDDNYPGERFAYVLGVYTGSRIGSSTDANVGIRLFGEIGSSRPHILKSSSRRVFRGNSDDWFLLYSPEHLGALRSIHVWHDNSATRSDWFLEKVKVYDLTDKFEYIFELNMWLALGANEYPEAVVATSSIEDFYSVKRVFLANVASGLRDNNYWISIFWKHSRNPVNRVLRISVVMSFIMASMTCSVIIYRFNKGENYTEDEPSYSLTYSDLIILIITTLIASLTAYVVMLFFRKSFSHRYVRMQSSLFLRPASMSVKRSTFYVPSESEPDADVFKNLGGRLSTVSLYDSTRPQFIELSYKHLDERFIRLGVRSKLPSERSIYEKLAAAVHAVVRGSALEPVRLQKYKRSTVLRKKYLFTAWFVFSIIILASTVVVIVFGHGIPKVESEKWLLVFLCVLLFDALILSNVKILLCSAILGCAFQRLVPASNYQLKAEDGLKQNLVGDTKYLLKLAQKRSHPMYCPLSLTIMELGRQKHAVRDQWRTLIDFLIFLLLTVVLFMLSTLFAADVYNANSHASRMLTQGPSFQYQNFTNIYNRTHYSKFLVHNFVDHLIRYLWYNNEHPLNDAAHVRRRSWTRDCTTRLLGSARIRQLRVILGECSDVGYFGDMDDYCSPPWSSGVEDAGSYSSRWRIGGSEDLSRGHTAWRYIDAAFSNSSVPLSSTLITYPAGGFIEDLGVEKDDVEDALSKLIPQSWLDHMTRAVFLELTLYNVNTELFSQVILIAEQMPTGEYLVGVKTESVTKDFSFDFWMLCFIVFLITFLVRMCVSTNIEGLFAYFSNTTNIFEGLMLTIGMLTLIFYIIHKTSSSSYIQEFQRLGTDKYFNFSRMISCLLLSRTFLCVLLVCVVLRMLISFRFGRTNMTFCYTFILSIPWIAWLVLCFVMCLVVFRRLIGYLLNIFVYPHHTVVVIYNKDFSADGGDSFQNKLFVYLMHLFSVLAVLMFCTGFVYGYKVAKVYKLVDTDSLNFVLFLKETIRDVMRKNLKVSFKDKVNA